MSFTYSIEAGKVKVVDSEKAGLKTYDPTELTAYHDGSSMYVRRKYSDGAIVTEGGLSDYSPTAADLDTLVSDYNRTYFAVSPDNQSQGQTPIETAAFGEQIVINETPIVQAAFTYDNHPEQFEEFSATGGSVSNSNALTVCQTGTSVGGYGLIRTNEYAVYRPGQGLSAKFTALFTTGVALSRQAAGFVASENELSIGYNGVDFAILLRTDGRLEIQTLTVTGGAGGGGNVTIELDGSSTAVAITAGSVQQNAWEISQGTFTGWAAFQRDDKVIFIATAVGDKTGGFSFTDTDATGATAGIAETRAGAQPTDTFINQSAWNVDRMDGGASGGPNPSGYTLIPTNLNVYKIDMQYLGAGDITYKIENPETGRFQTVHRIQYAGSSTSVSIRNPSFKFGWFAVSLGSTTNLTVSGGSCEVALQGSIEHTGIQETVNNIKSGIGATLTNIFTIRIDEEYKGIVSQVKIKLEAIDMAVEASGNNTSEIAIYRNATLAGTPDFDEVQADSPISIDTAGTTVTGGRLVRDFPFQKSGRDSVDLTPFEYTVGRGETITIAADVSGGTLEARVSLTYEILL